ncbi:hypothetical protein THARTR1_00445 [Trichoderma harzianum]|uniref:Uncharacterized protein n=1 Tax=Trichoderma harzianum TaxID=5544 RepID=A0A2K0URM0_TRIHA|nr:hypothetical protein THARTR1_00445 [Trichoderma harzianum]
MASPSALAPPPSDKAVMQGAGAGSSGPDPILRNALRYTISPREYAALHKYILSKSRALRRAAPSPSSVDKALQPRKGGDDYNAKAVRHSLRVFTATWIGMKVWDAVMKRLGSKE